MPLLAIMLSLKSQLLNPFNRFRTSIIIFLFFFTITLVLNFPYIHMPPVWDSVAVFSPAIYLYEHNFDFSGLLKQEGHVNGGPNIHSFSIVTFLTYFFISIAKGNPAFFFPALHAVQFLFSGIVLTCTFFVASRLFERRVAALITFAILFYPLFLVQTGYLYTEIPGAALVMCAIYAWASRYLFVSVLLAALACMVKSFGVVLICSLFFLFLFDTSIPRRQRLIWGVTLIFVMVGIELLKWTLSTANFTFEGSKFFEYMMFAFGKLNLVPDLKLFVLIVLITPCVFGLRQRPDNQVTVIDIISTLVSGDISQRLLVSVYLIPFVFVGFIAMLSLSGTSLFSLLRYYIWVLPLIFIGAVYTCRFFLCSILKHHSNLTGSSVNRVLVMLLTGLIFFFIANWDGRFYPSLDTDINSFSSAERSYEYLDFYKIQRDSVVSLAELQNKLPAFVTRGEYYYLSSPLMGYVKKHLNNIFLIVNKPYSSSNIDNFPDEFLLLDVSTQPLHGGKVVKEILGYARANPGYSVSELVRHHSGPYSSSIFKISRSSEPSILR